jgi:hypothetical protein
MPECLGEPPLSYPCPAGSPDLTGACLGELVPREPPPCPHQPRHRVSIARGDRMRSCARAVQPALGLPGRFRLLSRPTELGLGLDLAQALFIDLFIS